ncbi:carboxypeptidase-like regulatory domain-containing protein [Chitinophagaceae bacterium 26-R-25]|nr:carboxypeptidase-like regulatory domain-containing protein [Chitinophagaceae bacterium 26-R-25]
MIKRSVALLGILFVSCILTLSCNRDSNVQPVKPIDSTIVTPPIEPPKIETVTASVHGRITNNLQQPVQGATVIAGGKNATTDADGYFTINSAELGKNAGFVQVSKNGFFPGSRTFIVHPNAENTVSIQLIPKNTIGSFDNSSGGSVTISSGIGIAFPANATMNATTKNSYSGTVSVSAAYVDPTSPDRPVVMPGDHRGIDTSNKEVGLKSFGMLVVELNGANGEKLQLASGKNATLTIPIPYSMMGSSPTSIPLWYFNDSTGLWKEEGIATRQGVNYVGTVKHFSFWDFDSPFPLVNFEISLKDPNGHAFKNGKVSLNYIDDNRPVSAYDYTDANGTVLGKVPANTVFNLYAYSSCGGSIFSQSIGPFSSDTKLDTVTFDARQAPMAVTISGRVKDCSNNAVKSGYVDIFIDDVHQQVNLVNGAFSYTVYRCTTVPTQAVISTFDLAGNKIAQKKTVATTEHDVDAGEIIACGNMAEQFVDFKVIDGNDTTLYSFNPSVDTVYYMYNDIIYAWKKGVAGTPRLSIYFSGRMLYPGKSSIYLLQFEPILNQPYQDQTSDGVPITANISEVPIGSNNGIIAGDFSTTMKTWEGKQVKAECSFRLNK